MQGDTFIGRHVDEADPYCWQSKPLLRLHIYIYMYIYTLKLE